MIVPSACNEASKGDIAKAVLMPGDPLRAKYVAEHYLENAVCFNTVRNMFGYTGIYNGKPISVMGSGMGVPSIGLYAFELYNYFEVDSIIRIGSAGGIAGSIRLRDVVIAMGASTNSAYANQYCFPGTLAPLASYELLKYADEAAGKIGAHAVAGPVFTADQFYDANPESAKKYREMGILAVEMETAGLYLTAAKAGKKALSILTISDLVFTGEGLTALERQDSFTEMMEIALEAAWKSLE
ncbi:MAG: purine-nucleoside phosphorylase [Oscillospiraceae bacterium]|nr:purine-nucleoside phosphorylase [Oscillospiraceae bacterium]